MTMMRRLSIAGAGAGAVAGLYALVVRGDLTLDLRIGRRVRPLGPITMDIQAPRETVFDVIAAPYLARTPRALAEKLQVIERGEDMVLAAHYTKVHGLVATTLETVRFTRPERVDFRLVRGPVPHVVETFKLEERERVTTLEYTGELGTDLGWLGQAWGDRVALAWEAAVRTSLQGISDEAARRGRASA